MLAKIHANFIKANYCFTVWRSLDDVKNPGTVWIDKATANLHSMNNFKTFFQISMNSCKEVYLLELAKCFDNDKEVLSIYSVLTFAKANISELNYENYITQSWKPILLDEENYLPITMELLEECFKRVKWKSKIIRRLMNFRNGYLWHNQLTPNKDSKITVLETEELMKLLMEIWNTLSQHLFRTTWWHNFSDKNTYEEIERLLDFLHRFESYRIQEIRKESETRINGYKKNIK